MNKLKKVLFRNHKKYYWKEGDLHTDAGVVKEEDLQKDVKVVTAHSGKELQICKSNWNDSLEKLKRGPQSLLQKDIGMILLYANVNSESKVLDAGVGSGVLAAHLGRYAKEVVSYEKNEGHISIAQKNLDFLGINNVEIKLKDISEGIDEKDYDVITLDLPEPDKIVDHAFNALKQGGYIVIYVPSIVQVQKFVERAKHKFMVDKVVEFLEREWFVDGWKVRPKSQMQGHTAFLVFCRKV